MRLFIFLANSEVQRNQRKSQASFQRKIGPNTWKSKIALLLSSLLKKSREIWSIRNLGESDNFWGKVTTLKINVLLYMIKQKIIFPA